MKAWTITSGRPIGRYPKVYLVKPSISKKIDKTPWTPELEEWNSVEEAVNAVLEYISPEYALEHGDLFEEYYKDFRFVTKKEKVKERI